MSKFILTNFSVKTKFKNYLIVLSSDINSINISIQLDNEYNIYQSNFNLEYFHTYKLFKKFTIKDLIEFFLESIEQKRIKIEKKNSNLKLTFISKLTKSPNIELQLNKKNLSTNEIIEILFKEIENLKDENKRLNERLEIIEKKEKEKNEIEKRIKRLEGYHLLKDKQKIQLKNTNIKNINSINPHKGSITSMSSFPLGNIISVSTDKSINIYDINFNVIQNIQNAHNSAINYVEVKDDNNFITCSKDKSIKLWIKKENEFIINKIIENAHDDIIIKVINCSNGHLISCSFDKTIKIWEEKNDGYESNKILTHSNKIVSLLLLEDKNILISSGGDWTKFWSFNENEINNINLIHHFEETFCGWNEGICRLSEYIVIVNDKETTILKLISISKKEIIKVIVNPFRCFGIVLIENKGIFLVSGKSKDIIIYRNDNYECIQIIKNAHNHTVTGFIELKDNSFASFSEDKNIKVWCF